LEDAVRTTKRFLLVCSMAAVAALLATATANADYGSKAVYQVEISSNPPGSGVWLWAELDPGGASGDYQETDCIHLPKLGLVGALHDSGSVSGWDISNGQLNIRGVLVVGGAETVDISIPLPAGGYGHASTIFVTPVLGPPIISGAFPAQVQLAP
jgi:hypothetical protein